MSDGVIVSLRLEKPLAKRLEAAAKAKGIPKSQLIRQCLEEYLANDEQQPTAWERGRHLLGRHGSGRTDLAERCEEILRETFPAKTIRNETSH